MKKLYNVHTIWMSMMVLTFSTYTIGKLGYAGTTAVLFLLLTAIIKGTFIIGDFMQLRGVSLLWRVIMYGWLWVVTGTIAITYLVSQ